MLFVDHEPRLSGGERDLVDLVRALGDRIEGHAAVPAEGPLAAALRTHGVTVHVVPMAAGLLGVSRWELATHPWRALVYAGAVVTAMARLARLTRMLRPDIVHTNSMKAHLLAAPAARVSRARLIWHIRDILEPGWVATAFAALAGAVPDRVVSLSHAAAAPLRSRADRKVRVVHNGIRLAEVNSHAREDARNRVGASGPDDVVVGIVGQIAHWKGQDVFIEAATMIAPDRPHVRFAVVGECLFGENEAAYEAGLHDQVEAAGLNDRIAFTGSIEPIDPVMHALDIVVHASRLPEPFGRVIVEAMAAGAAVVASARGAGPELVPPEAGRLVEPGDAPALAAALAELVDDAELRSKIGDEARRVATGFDISATGDGVAAVYTEFSSRND